MQLKNCHGHDNLFLTKTTVKQGKFPRKEEKKMHDGHHHHHHEHAHGLETGEQAKALLTYMLEHNKHHAEELHEMSHNLEHLNKSEASNLLDAAVDHFRAGNEMLEAALESLKKED